MNNSDINSEYVGHVRRIIGSWIKDFRKQKKLTQIQLANLLGITEGTVCKIENGKWLSLEMLIKLSINLDFYIFLLEKNSDDDLVEIMRNRWIGTHQENDTNIQFN